MFEILAVTLLSIAGFCVLEGARFLVALRVEQRRLKIVRQRLVGRAAAVRSETENSSLLLREGSRAVVSSRGYLGRLENSLRAVAYASGWRYGMRQLFGLSAITCVGLGACVWFLGSEQLAIWVAGLLGAGFPWLILYQRARTWRRQIDLQLPEALDMVARATQVGHSLGMSLSQAADELSDPVARELVITANEIALSNDPSRAFRNLADRIGSGDSKFLALAVAVQDETGGGLVHILRKLSAVIRLRFKLKSRITSIVAGPRFTVRMLLVLPVFLVGMLWVNDPGTLAPLWEEAAGHRLMALSALGLVIGIGGARYVSRVKV